jgi:hypothetical protein
MFYDKCPKQAKRDILAAVAEDKKIKNKTKDHFERVLQPSYYTRNFAMTPYDPKEFIPGAKSQLQTQTAFETTHPKVISIAELDKVERHMKTKLSRMDLLEVCKSIQCRLGRIQPTSYKIRNYSSIDMRIT